MNFRKTIRLDKLEFQIAPMIGIVFLLLIFFIVTWGFARWETQMDITVPTAKEAVETRRQPGEIIVNIDKSGSLIVNQKKFTFEELLMTLKGISRQFPDQSIIIRADQHVEYQMVIRVLDICRMADIGNIGLATRREETGDRP